MNKLKILWKNKRTWVDAFKAWHVLMYPHLYDFPEQGWRWTDESSASLNGWWFWEYINNFNNDFDEVDQ
jgi:hypothetical protein